MMVKAILAVCGAFLLTAQLPQGHGREGLSAAGCVATTDAPCPVMLADIRSARDPGAEILARLRVVKAELRSVERDGQ